MKKLLFIAFLLLFAFANAQQGKFDDIRLDDRIYNGIDTLLCPSGTSNEYRFMNMTDPIEELDGVNLRYFEENSTDSVYVGAGIYYDGDTAKIGGSTIDSLLFYSVDYSESSKLADSALVPKKYVDSHDIDTLFTTIAISDETSDLTTGTAKRTFRMPIDCTITEIRASVNTAPTGSTIIVDINESGTTILSTKLSIDASEKTSVTAATPPVISDSSIADDAEMTIDIDQIGSTIAGKGLKIKLYYIKN